MKNWISLLVIMLVAFAVPVVAQEDMVDPGITPDSFLWGIERATENINLFLTFDVDKKIEKRLNYAEKRLSEIEAMADIGNLEAAQKAGEAHGKFFSDLKQNIQDFENGDGEEELKKVLEFERKIRAHNNKLDNLDGKLNIKISIEGQITPEQQVLMDSVLAGLEGQIGELKIEIENEKGKKKIKIERELGKDGDKVEIEIEEELGLTEELREDAQEEIDELEEELAELVEDGIVVPESIINLFEQAKIAFESGDYRTAETLAKQGNNQMGDFEDDLEEELEREIEVEIENGRARIEIEVGKNKYKFSLETTDKESIIDEIAARTGLSREEVLAIAEFEVEEEETAEEAKEKAFDAIDDARENIAISQNDIDEGQAEGQDTTEAEAKLVEAQTTLDEAQKEFDAENFIKAKELAEKAYDVADEAEDLIGVAQMFGEKVGDAIKDAKQNIGNAQKDIDDTKEQGQDTTEAEAKLVEAQTTLDEAQKEFDAENFIKAKELAEKADNLADEAEGLVL